MGRKKKPIDFDDWPKVFWWQRFFRAERDLSRVARVYGQLSRIGVWTKKSIPPTTHQPPTHLPPNKKYTFFARVSPKILNFFSNSLWADGTFRKSSFKNTKLRGHFRKKFRKNYEFSQELFPSHLNARRTATLGPAVTSYILPSRTSGVGLAQYAYACGKARFTFFY